MTFLLSEDEALRNHLMGITVFDEASPSGRSVGVWFGQPDAEIRDQRYPYITIELFDISEARERVMRAWDEVPFYLRNTLEPFDPATEGAKMDLPLPVNLDYQITTYARHPRHDRQIVSQIMSSKIPTRGMNLLVMDDPENNNGTWRRLDLLDISKRDNVEGNRRLFTNMFSVRISSEITPLEITRLKRTSTIDLSINGTVTGPNGLAEPITPITITIP